MAVRGWGGGQAAGVGRVRGLAGRGGVICKSEHKLEQARALGSGFWVLGSGWTYLSWQAGRGTREFLQTASRATAPGASWERRAWSRAAGSSRRPG